MVTIDRRLRFVSLSILKNMSSTRTGTIDREACSVQIIRQKYYSLVLLEQTTCLIARVQKLTYYYYCKLITIITLIIIWVSSCLAVYYLLIQYPFDVQTRCVICLFMCFLTNDYVFVLQIENGTSNLQLLPADIG